MNHKPTKTDNRFLLHLRWCLKFKTSGINFLVGVGGGEKFILLVFAFFGVQEFLVDRLEVLVRGPVLLLFAPDA